jgi:hypothetical protein
MTRQTKNEKVATHTQAQSRTEQTVEFTIQQRYLDVVNRTNPQFGKNDGKHNELTGHSDHLTTCIYYALD